MADYEPLITRAVANLQSASTAATRRAIYERLRKAQLSQLGMLRPPLPESEIAGEKEALEQAIALTEAKFGGADSTQAEQLSAAATSAPPARQVGVGSSPTDASTEASIPLSSLAKAASPRAHAAKSKSWLWFPLAAVLGAILVIAGASIAMRQKPRYVAAAPQVARQEPAPQRPANIAKQWQAYSTAPTASVPPGSQPTVQSGAGPADEAPDASNSAAPGTARAAILIGSDNPHNPVVSRGSTVWSIIPPARGQPATVAVKADADIPDLKMHATMILRKNTDPSLQATHTIDLKLSLADGATITGVKDVEPKMGNLGSTASEALTSFRVKISDVYFLIALAKGDQKAARNLDLMQTRTWFDFALLFTDNRIGKLVIQKSPQGETMLTKAFEAWK